MRQNELDFIQNKKLNSHIKKKIKSDSFADQVCWWCVNTGGQAHRADGFKFALVMHVYHFDLDNYANSCLV